MSANLKFHQLDLNKLLQSNSILDLVNTKLLNNQSLNAVMNIKFDKIKNFNYLKDISLKAYFEEGNIFIKNSSLNWKNSVMIDLENVQLMSENNSIIFSGSVKFNFENINDFYSHYQINRKLRKKINKMNFGFFFNLNEKFVEIDNFKIDGVSNKNLNLFLNNLNSKKQNIFNKITFRNSIKEFFNNL